MRAKRPRKRAAITCVSAITALSPGRSPCRGSVDVEHIEAETKNGVLELHLPKKEEVKPKRISVKVKSGDKVIEGKSK